MVRLRENHFFTSKTQYHVNIYPRKRCYTQVIILWITRRRNNIVYNPTTVTVALINYCTYNWSYWWWWWSTVFEYFPAPFSPSRTNNVYYLADRTHDETSILGVLRAHRVLDRVHEGWLRRNTRAIISALENAARNNTAVGTIYIEEYN